MELQKLILSFSVFNTGESAFRFGRLAGVEVSGSEGVDVFDRLTDMSVGVESSATCMQKSDLITNKSEASTQLIHL